jgi:DNA-binding transcriptional LysR family regulator
MDLKRLRNFAVVAAAGSFHGAAEQLYIAQPALSRQMRSLEEELGVALFERSVRGVKLSSAGEVLLSELERLLPQIDLAMSRTERAAKGQVGILRVAYTQVAAELSFTAAAFAEARRAMPEVDIRLSFIASDYQIEKLTAGEIDVGLLYRRPPTSVELAYRDLRVGKYQLVVPKNHPFAQRGSVKLSDLDDEEILFSSKSLRPVTYNELMAAFVRAGVKPRIAMEPDTERISLNMVAEGVGMFFANTSVLERRSIEGVASVAIEDFDLPLHLAVMWKRDRETPAIIRFVDLLVSHNGRKTPNRKRPKGRKSSPGKR